MRHGACALAGLCADSGVEGLAVTGAAVKRCHQAVLGEGQDLGPIITPGSCPGTSGTYKLTAEPSGSASNSAG